MHIDLIDLMLVLVPVFVHLCLEKLKKWRIFSISATYLEGKKKRNPGTLSPFVCVNHLHSNLRVQVYQTMYIMS